MVKEYLKELENEGIIEITKEYAENKIFHFNNIIDEHYSIAKVDGIWELMEWKNFDIVKVFANDKELINGLFLYV